MCGVSTYLHVYIYLHIYVSTYLLVSGRWSAATTRCARCRSRTRRAATSSPPCRGSPSPRATPSSWSSRYHPGRAWRSSNLYSSLSTRYLHDLHIDLDIWWRKMLLFNFVIVPYCCQQNTRASAHWFYFAFYAKVSQLLHRGFSVSSGASIIVFPKFSLIPHYPHSSPVKCR